LTQFWHFVKEMNYLDKRGPQKMAKEKKTRKELLKGTDEFMSLAGRVAVYVKEHSRQIQYAGIAILALAVLYMAVNTFLGYINKKGQKAYNSAYYALMEAASDQGPDYVKASALFEAVKKDYKYAKVSALIPAQLAYAKYLEKEYDHAIRLYEEYLDGLPEQSPFQSLTRLALAACYEEKGDAQGAITSYEAVMGGPDNYLRDMALFGLARAYRLSGQPQKAEEMLRRFIEEYKESPYLPLAEALLHDLSSFS
jgi:outer membrane protein assembly factor BamD (BamD/ComL family)